MFGAGCFWGVEAAIRDVPGVLEVTSGYSGGERPAPSYEDVCTGDTGHAEVVQVEFDPSVITFPEILEVFFAMHDPTTLNRQGGDVGTQYRSAIFFHSAGQEDQARALIAEVEAEGVWDGTIVTEVAPYSCLLYTSPS